MACWLPARTHVDSPFGQKQQHQRGGSRISAEIKRKSNWKPRCLVPLMLRSLPMVLWLSPQTPPNGLDLEHGSLAPALSWQCWEGQKSRWKEGKRKEWKRFEKLSLSMSIGITAIHRLSNLLPHMSNATYPIMRKSKLCRWQESFVYNFVHAPLVSWTLSKW